MFKNYQKIFLIIFFTLFFSSTVFAAEVPFEVIKTKVRAKTTVEAGPEGVVVDGVLQDTGNEVYNEGGWDPRTMVPIDNINYELEFWNVGKLGGEKGFIFKSNYEKAKLTITYEAGQAHRMQSTGKKFEGMEMTEDVKVRTPNFKDTFTYNLFFTGGPYGKFLYKTKDGSYIQIAYIEDGEYIHFDQFPEKKYLFYSNEVLMKIENSSAFEKWMEILNSQELGCSEPGNSQKDSGIRFSDYQGEVMIRPCDDEDAWYGAELDMVLHKDDYIRTEDDSTCVLSLADMTTFYMKPNSTIVLSSPSEKENKIKLIWGKIKTNFKQMIEDGTMDVEMSQAVAGIKGTVLITEETGTESTLKVIEGHVAFTSKTTGKTEMVGPGGMVIATKDGLGKKKEFNVKKEKTTWESSEAMIKNSHKNTSNLSNILYIFAVSLLLIVTVIFVYKKYINK